MSWDLSLRNLRQQRAEVKQASPGLPTASVGHAVLDGLTHSHTLTHTWGRVGPGILKRNNSPSPGSLRGGPAGSRGWVDVRRGSWNTAAPLWLQLSQTLRGTASVEVPSRKFCVPFLRVDLPCFLPSKVLMVKKEAGPSPASFSQPRREQNRQLNRHPSVYT